MGKAYDNEEEYFRRQRIFSDNLKKIKEFNSRNESYKLGLTVFADMKYEEFEHKFLMPEAPQQCSATRSISLPIDDNVLPNAVDWRNEGVVTPVKNQGACGSCWSFSATGAMESHHAIKTNHLVSLSEKQLMDCSTNFDNHGCGGGLPSQAFEYVRYNRGIELEADYPYVPKNGKCRFNSSNVAATVATSFNITSYDEEEITRAVAVKGPVSVCLDVVGNFHLYKSGVYANTQCHKSHRKVNHAVLAVGYNVTEGGDKYWIIKNSWGTGFGMNGYFWLKRGVNMCGVASCASYPVV
ncbi:pro-cathepsin H-like isoform X2 [Corticium candelabrum]|nr:pro-cathepsin H-like isoform X2 [Corticium candelabrum]XP_062516615.1 pro-cathepsin H-like isoform X2 [Corticium candelabrum]